MSGKFGSQGAQNVLKAELKDAAPPNYVLKLFTNDISTWETVANFTELTGYGYAPITLARADWTITWDGTARKSVATQPQKTFTFTAGTQIKVFGYFIVRADNGELVRAQRFYAAAGEGEIIGNEGDQIKIVVRFLHNAPA